MTRFQLVAMWGLRALALWTLVEVGLSLSENVQTQVQSWQSAARHDEIVQRLERKARAAEARRTIQSRAMPASLDVAATDKTNPIASLERRLRTPLTAAGAQELRIQAAPYDTAAKLTVLEGELSWLEPREGASRALRVLHTHAPNLSVHSVSMLVGSDGRVRTKVRFRLLARSV